MSNTCVINLNTACVVCLQSESVQFRSVFEMDDQSEMSIAEKISKCSDLHIQSDDNTIPDRLCQYCLDDLNAAWRFRKNCEAAKLVFESIQLHDKKVVRPASGNSKQPKLHLPSGLKIKKQETKPIVSLNSPVNVKGKPVYELEMSMSDVDMPIDGEESGEHYEINEYFDEETLEELDDVENENENENEIKYENEDFSEDDIKPNFELIERLDESNSQKSKLKSTATTNYLNIKKDIKGRSKDTKVQSTVQVLPKKRARGRPKKYLSEDELKIEDDESKLSQIESGTEHNKQHIARLKNKLESSKSDRKRKLGSGEGKPAKICEICGNCYRFQHALNAHMRRHTNDRPFGCEFCDKAFVSGVELRRHMRVHTGHKPYACQYCDRRFSDFGSRIKHERTHTGERPYRCSTCGKSFAYAHVLSVHLRTHTGEKKFQCEICNKGFTKKAYLQAHMQHHTQSTKAYRIEDMIMSQSDQDTELKIIPESDMFPTDYIFEVDEEEEKPNIVIEENDMDEVQSADIEEENLEETSDVEYILDEG